MNHPIITSFLQHLYSIGVLIGILIAIVPIVDSQVMIASTLTAGRLVCPGDSIKFTCITRGSITIAWRSEEYVERGGTQLEFDEFRDINSMKKSPVHPNTVATFIDRTEEGGIVVLKSQLRIVASSDFPTSTVMCIHSNGSLERVSFQLLGDPHVPEIEHDPIQKEMTGERETACLLSFDWKPVINVTHYVVHVDEKYLVNETSTYTAFVVPGCTVHRLRLQAVNMCGRLSVNITKDVPHSGSELTSFIELSNGDTFTNASRDSTTSSPAMQCSSCNDTCTAFIIVTVLFILLLTIIVLVVIFITVYKIRGNSKNEVCICFKGEMEPSRMVYMASNIRSLSGQKNTPSSSEHKSGMTEPLSSEQETDTENKKLSAHGTALSGSEQN